MSGKTAKPLSADALERRRARCRAYYYAHREKMNAQARAYYQKKGKAWNTERVRKYRQANRESVLAAQRIYRAANREKFRAAERTYQQRNKEKLAAYRKRYWEEHRYALCARTLNQQFNQCVDNIRAVCSNRVDAYFALYPFEQFAARQIALRLANFNIYTSQARYADCYDAGMLAYIYSIHRCALKEYTQVGAYIRKMIRIFILCALVVFNEVSNLCRENHFRPLYLDAPAFE